MRATWIRGLLLLLLCLLHGNASAVDSTAPGMLSWRATSRSLGFTWFVEGDSNRNCAVAVQYREDPGGAWRAAQPLLRVVPESQNYHNVDPGNLLAGSILGLTPEAAYEVRLALLDPDGGAATETLAVQTRPDPMVSPRMRVRWVVPGAGGGSGTEADPFRGLPAAVAQAQPGDLFRLRSGSYYGSFSLNVSGTAEEPVVWEGESAESVLLDGENIFNPVVDLSGAQYVFLENMTIRRPGQTCILGPDTNGVVVRNCILQIPEINGPDMTAIDFRGLLEEDAVISGNVIQGPLHWEDGRIDDHYGVRITGRGHEIRYNRIFDWWDGIDVGADMDSIVTSDCDVCGNEIYNCTDDGVEADGSRRNIRIMGNRMTNVLTGVSCQPVYGGPIYIVRNVIYNFQLKPMKFHEWPTGLLVFNNTMMGAYPLGWYGGQWKNGELRNNLMLGGSRTGCGIVPAALSDEAYEMSQDHDGFYQPVADRFAYFNRVMYPTIEAFRLATGQETHGVLVDSTVFAAAGEPALGSCLGATGYPPAYEPGSANLSLRPGSVAIDAGEDLADVTDAYVGSAPDLGAYEYGLPQPEYGPEADPTADVPEAAGRVAGLLRAVKAQGLASGPVRITFELVSAGSVCLRVFDVAGRQARLLLPASPLAEGTHVLSWDGRSDQGAVLPSGVYFFTLECRALGRGQSARQAGGGAVRETSEGRILLLH